jgi:hypothetical protein
VDESGSALTPAEGKGTLIADVSCFHPVASTQPFLGISIHFRVPIWIAFHTKIAFQTNWCVQVPCCGIEGYA